MDYNAQKFGATQSDHFWFKSRVKFWEWLLSSGLTQEEKCKRLKILNIGCGIGDDLELFNRFGDIYALDLDQKTLDMVSDDLVKEKVCADACKMPYKDKFFDVVIAFDIFEHIFDDKKAAEEVKRVLKKEGVLFVTVPAFSFLYSVHDRMTGHVRRYNKRQVRALFKDFKQSLFGFWFFSLFFLAVLQRLFTKKKTTSDFYQQKTPKLIHRILYKIVTLDNWLIRKGVSFPWGLTIYGVYRNL